MVTSRATDDDLIDDQEARPSDIMAPPQAVDAQADRSQVRSRQDGTTRRCRLRRYGRRRCFAERHAGGRERGCPGASANGTRRLTAARSAPRGHGRRGRHDRRRRARAARRHHRVLARHRPKGSGPDQEAAGSKAVDQPAAGDSPAFSFGPPPSASAQPAVEDPTIAYPAESAVMPPGDDRSATTPAGTVPSGSAPRSGDRPAFRDSPSEPGRQRCRRAAVRRRPSRRRSPRPRSRGRCPTRRPTRRRPRRGRSCGRA